MSDDLRDVYGAIDPSEVEDRGDWDPALEPEGLAPETAPDGRDYVVAAWDGGVSDLTDPSPNLYDMNAGAPAVLLYVSTQGGVQVHEGELVDRADERGVAVEDDDGVVRKAVAADMDGRPNAVKNRDGIHLGTMLDVRLTRPWGVLAEHYGLPEGVEEVYEVLLVYDDGSEEHVSYHFDREEANEARRDWSPNLGQREPQGVVVREVTADEAEDTDDDSDDDEDDTDDDSEECDVCGGDGQIPVGPGFDWRPCRACSDTDDTRVRDAFGEVRTSDEDDDSGDEEEGHRKALTTGAKMLTAADEGHVIEGDEVRVEYTDNSGDDRVETGTVTEVDYVAEGTEHGPEGRSWETQNTHASLSYDTGEHKHEHRVSAQDGKGYLQVETVNPRPDDAEGHPTTQTLGTPDKVVVTPVEDTAKDDDSDDESGRTDGGYDDDVPPAPNHEVAVETGQVGDLNGDTVNPEHPGDEDDDVLTPDDLRLTADVVATTHCYEDGDDVALCGHPSTRGVDTEPAEGPTWRSVDCENCQRALSGRYRSPNALWRLSGELDEQDRISVETTDGTYIDGVVTSPADDLEPGSLGTRYVTFTTAPETVGHLRDLGTEYRLRVYEGETPTVSVVDVYEQLDENPEREVENIERTGRYDPLAGEDSEAREALLQAVEQYAAEQQRLAEQAADDHQHLWSVNYADAMNDAAYRLRKGGWPVAHVRQKVLAKLEANEGRVADIYEDPERDNDDHAKASGRRSGREALLRTLDHYGFDGTEGDQ